MGYDYLILAPGSHHSYFGKDEWENFAPGLKTLSDALTIREKIINSLEMAEKENDAATKRKLLTFVIVGGGPTGVEFAAFLKDENGKILPATAPVAMQQGRYVAKIINGELKGKSHLAFRYIDKGNVATIGKAKAVVEIKGFKLYGFFAWLIWCSIHIFYLIGFKNRFRVMVEWIWYYMTNKRGTRLIVGK